MCVHTPPRTHIGELVVIWKASHRAHKRDSELPRSAQQCRGTQITSTSLRMRVVVCSGAAQAYCQHLIVLKATTSHWKAAAD